MPAIILAALFYSFHHAGFQPEFVSLFFVGLFLYEHLPGCRQPAGFIIPLPGASALSGMCSSTFGMDYSIFRWEIGRSYTGPDGGGCISGPAGINRKIKQA